MTITGKARLAGVMGWPVGHSKSPALHNYWLGHYGIDGAYLPLPVRPENFDAVLAAMPKMGFRGANLTIPHKEAVMARLDDLDPVARRIGAVNTIHWRDDGALYGTNSDGAGFLANLLDHHPGFDAAAGPVIIIGAGGAARAVAAVLQDAGAPRITIVNRSAARAETLIRNLGGAIDFVPLERLPAVMEGAQLLVNSTSLGMTGQPPLDITLSPLPKRAIVADLVYAPLETALLRDAAARGLKVVEGLGMLLHQACKGFELWFGTAPAVTEDLRRRIQALA